MPNLERTQQLRAWGWIPIPSGKGESQELEAPSECDLQPPGKRSGSGSESEEGAKLEALGAEEAERDVSPGELPQPLKKGSLEEECFAEVTEEAEEGENRATHRRKAGSQRKGQSSGEDTLDEGDPQHKSSSSSSGLRGLQRRKSKSKELEEPWGLEKLQRQLQQELDCGECGLQCLGPRGNYTVGREVGEPATWARSSDRAGLGSRYWVGSPNRLGWGYSLTCPTADRP